MSIRDVQAFDDYEFYDMGDYKPVRDPLVHIARDLWDEQQLYINRLEERIAELEEELYGTNDTE